MYLCPIQLADVKVSAAAPSKDEAFLPGVLHLIEEPEAFDQIFRLVTFAVTASVYLCLVDLPVVTADFPLEEYHSTGSRVRMAADAPSVNIVLLEQSVTNPGVLGDITVGHMYLPGSVLFPELVVHCPSTA